MTLEQFLDVPDAPQRSIGVLNRTEPEPFQRMIESLFSNQPISVSEYESDESEQNTVALLEDGEVVATSSLSELQDAILMINSDLFITGTRKLEQTTVPAVLDGLTDTRFLLRGYPESNSEKLLLILISRHIEKRAFETGGGELRSSFQRLSRIEDEQGTNQVYRQVADTDVSVHIYGQPDWTPEPSFPVTIHGGYSFDFRSSWFVIHTPPSDSNREPAALLAIEQEPRTWDGFFTYDAEIVANLAGYVQRNL